MNSGIQAHLYCVLISSGYLEYPQSLSFLFLCEETFKIHSMRWGIGTRKGDRKNTSDVKTEMIKIRKNGEGALIGDK